MPLITEEDREFFENNGYVKIPNIVPEENCDAAIDAIWECLGQDPDDPETWYQPPQGMEEHWNSRSGGMVELTHHQSLWDNRQHPKVYQAFAELLGEEKLWVSMDRCNMTPPSHPDHPELNDSFIHWDVDISDLPDVSVQPRGTERVPYGLQGVLYLDDIAENQGTFQCAPSVYRNIEEWADADRNLDEDELEEKIVKVPGEQGDIVIWDSLLAHGNSVNTAEEPRFAQYITMSPANFEDHEQRRERIEMWRNLETYGDEPRGWERENLDTPELTALGQKLLGLDPWQGWLSE